eukprot:jgi/Mesvir1/5696/Mv15711-RA.1
MGCCASAPQTQDNAAKHAVRHAPPSAPPSDSLDKSTATATPVRLAAVSLTGYSSANSMKHASPDGQRAAAAAQGYPQGASGLGGHSSNPAQGGTVQFVRNQYAGSPPGNSQHSDVGSSDGESQRGRQPTPQYPPSNAPHSGGQPAPQYPPSNAPYSGGQPTPQYPPSNAPYSGGQPTPQYPPSNAPYPGWQAPTGTQQLSAQSTSLNPQGGNQYGNHPYGVAPQPGANYALHPSNPYGGAPAAGGAYPPVNLYASSQYPGEPSRAMGNPSGAPLPSMGGGNQYPSVSPEIPMNGYPSANPNPPYPNNGYPSANPPYTNHGYQMPAPSNQFSYPTPPPPAFTPYSSPPQNTPAVSHEDVRLMPRGPDYAASQGAPQVGSYYSQHAPAPPPSWTPSGAPPRSTPPDPPPQPLKSQRSLSFRNDPDVKMTDDPDVSREDATVVVAAPARSRPPLVVRTDNSHKLRTSLSAGRKTPGSLRSDSMLRDKMLSPHLASDLLSLKSSAVGDGAQAAPAADAFHFGYATGFAEKYEVKKLLGRGAFGSVSLVVSRETGAQFAAKAVSKEAMGSIQGLDGDVRREVAILQRMRNSLGVVNLHGVFESSSHVYMLLDYCGGGDLSSYMTYLDEQGEVMVEEEVASLMRQILRMVAQCHALRIVHRDIKPSNLLFRSDDRDGQLMLIDFGLATMLERDVSTTQGLSQVFGTPAYMAPEVILQKYGLKADVWSAGVVMYLLLSGRLPFAPADGSGSLVAQLQATLDGELDLVSPPFDRVSAPAKDLLNGLLNKRQRDRLSARKALQHPFLAEKEGEGGLRNTLVQRLQHFTTYSGMKKQLLGTLSSHLPPDDGYVKALSKLFREMDVDGSDSIDADELLAGLTKMGYDMSKEEVDTLMEEIDLDCNGQVKLTEFVTALMPWKTLQKSKEWGGVVASAFQAVDKDGNGVLEMKELEGFVSRSRSQRPRAQSSASVDLSNESWGTLELSEPPLTTGENGAVSFDQFLAELTKSDGMSELTYKEFTSRRKPSFSFK